MIIDESLILKLEKLARLELSEEARAKMQSELEDIMTMVGKLDEVDTAGIAPLMHLSEVENVMRDDVVENQLSLENALRNAKEQMSPYFKVPKVIDRTKK